MQVLAVPLTGWIKEIYEARSRYTSEEHGLASTHGLHGHIQAFIHVEFPRANGSIA
jgi:hypothetical protein